jgi:hypothetical protein
MAGNIKGSIDGGSGNIKHQNGAADVINAGANAVDSIGGIINTFAGGGSPGNNTAPPTPAPVEENKPNWFLIGGVGVGIVGLIALLMYFNKKEAGNGTAAKK